MSDFLAHYGVQGQKWGERRYQYQDGSYTPEGRIHYGIGDGRRSKNSDLAHATEVQISKDPITPKEKKKILNDDAKKALMIIGGVALAAGVAYGVYAVSQNLPPETVSSIIEAVGANSNTEEQIESIAKVVDSGVIDKALEKPIESVVPKNVAESLNTPISDAVQHPYTIEGSEKANKLFNQILDQPMTYASHHLNPATLRLQSSVIGELDDKDYEDVDRAISAFMKTNGVPDSVLIKNTPDYGLKTVAGYETKTDNVRSVYEFAKKNPNVLAFSNSMFADVWGRDNMFKEKELSTEERSAAVEYTTGAYKRINGLLRGTYKKTPELKSTINNLTHAIDKHELSEDVMIHRAVKLDSREMKKFFNQKNVVGQTFFDKSFGSTSLSNYDTALNHVDSSRIVIHSIAPKGTKAMYLEPVTTATHELELLLQRGSGYKVLDVVKDSNGRITDVFAQIVQNDNLKDL